MISQYFLRVCSLSFRFPVVSFEEQILSFGEVQRYQFLLLAIILSGAC